MNKYMVVSFLIVLVIALVFVVFRNFTRLKDAEENTEANTDPKPVAIYMIEQEKVSREKFLQLKDTLRISDSSDDLTTTDGGFSWHSATSQSGEKYSYLEGVEGGVAKYIIRHDADR